MTREKRKTILQRIGFYSAVVLLCIGAWFLVRYEYARMKDAMKMTSIAESQSVLSIYAARHGIYPSSPEGQLVIGESSSICVSRRGLVDPSSDQCREHGYGLLTGEQAYRSMSVDHKTLCSDLQGCPWYEIEFLLQTNVIAPAGLHTVTPEGLH